MAPKKLKIKNLVDLIKQVPDEALRNKLLKEATEIEESTNTFFKQLELDKIPELA